MIFTDRDFALCAAYRRFSLAALLRSGGGGLGGREGEDWTRYEFVR